MAEHKISWLNQPGYTGETWNPITGCTTISEGCANCYAARVAKRLAGRAGYPKQDPFSVRFHPDKLDLPYRWKKPRCIFVCSMGDLWHPDVRFENRAAVLRVMKDCPQHRFLCLTKRAANVPAYWLWVRSDDSSDGSWPPNVWLGTTAENQRRAGERIPHLLRCQAAVRFVSLEPLLGPVNLCQLAMTDGDVPYDLNSWITYHNCLTGFRTHKQGGSTDENFRLDWLIVAPETGPRRRPSKLDWTRSLVDQGQAAGVPVYVKAVDLGDRVSADPAEWPEEFPREFPEVGG